MDNLSLYISTILLLCVTAAGATGKCSAGDKCIVFLDIGRSSTHLKVYSYSTDPAKKLPKIELCSKSQRFTPGVSAFDDVNGLRTYMTPILAAAKAIVASSEQAKTPVLALARHVEQSAGLTNLVGLLKDPAVSPFKYNKASVKVLSKDVEGVYSWLALNYLLGKFDSGSPATDTYGIMDMDEDESRIAFLPKRPQYKNELFKVEILNNVYEVYGHNYLHFGTESIELQVAASLKTLKNSPRNPCLLQGDNKKYTLKNKFTINSKTYTPKPITVEDAGYGSPQMCKRILLKLTARSRKCRRRPCAIGSTYQPMVKNVPFYATGGFLDAIKFHDAVGQDSVVNKWQLRRPGEDYCAKTLEDALHIPNKKNSRKHASARCLQSQYFPVLWDFVYKIPHPTVIKAAAQIKGQDIDWALGAVLVEVSNQLNIKAAVTHNKKS